MKSKKKGFTLVEIMIVVLIIGLLAALAIPSFMRARATTQSNACINNLRQIDHAKEQWAMETGAIPTATPFDVDINPYIKGVLMPLCPVGAAVYDINDLLTNPTCPNAAALGGHVLPIAP